FFLLWGKKKHLLVCAGASLAAVFCKEFAVILPGIILFVVLLTGRKLRQTGKVLAGRSIKLLLPSLMAVFFLFWSSGYLSFSRKSSETRTPMNSRPVTVVHTIERAWSEGLVPREYYLCSQPLIILKTYVPLLIFPLNQSLDHEYQVIRSPGKPEFLIPALVLSVWLVTAILCYRKLPHVTVGTFLIFLPLLPTSSVIPNFEFVNEARLYPSLPGWAILCAGFLASCQGSKRFHLLFSLGAVYILCLGGLTLHRNYLWCHPMLLWEDAVRKNPQIARPWAGLGLVCYHQGNYQRARMAFTRALRLKPSYLPALTMLGLIAEQEGDLKAALQYFSQALRRYPDHHENLYNVARCLLKAGMLKEAEQVTNRLLEKNPQHRGALFNILQIYLRRQETQKAASIIHRLEALPLSPSQRKALEHFRSQLHQ
ncbi:MAG: tetratricopeptide repeat protein, partial [Lentisphaerae bacterium]